MSHHWRFRILDPVYLRFKSLFASIGHFLRLRRGDMSRISEAPVSLKMLLVPKMNRPTLELECTFPSREDVIKTCTVTHAITGIWPISFSYPESVSHTEKPQKSGYFCPVFPGHKYAFSNEAEYLGNYSRYEFALTHKKAGWDCFRHLEILYSGTVPFMPDAELIPPHTMVHYPKAFLAEVARNCRTSQLTLTDKTVTGLRTYFNDNLTCKAMADYMLSVSGLNRSRRILFVDASLPQMPDYLSVFTLIGLKKLRGENVSVSHPVPYVYDDWTGSTAELYGRGFGYTLSLPASLRTSNEKSEEVLPLVSDSLIPFDSVIVGSVERNSELAINLLAIFPPDRTVWIHGEDQPASENLVKSAQRAGVHFFAREII